MSDSIFLKRVVLSNYKSIKECSVELGPLTFLVGPNGAGKSNFLDALRLVAESLYTSLDQAMRTRGGITEVRRRSFGKASKKGKGRPTNFGIRLEWQLPDNTSGSYAFSVGAKSPGGFEVQTEECRVSETDGMDKAWYRVECGKVVDTSEPSLPVATADQLYLIRASGVPVFRPIFEALSHMGFYNLNPDAIRELQAPAPGEVLRRDGSNLASVLSFLEKHKEVRNRVLEFLGIVVPGITDVTVKRLGKKETLEFKQEAIRGEVNWQFMAESMSDGTLRALGILTALFQATIRNGHRVPLVGIEEPETAVHPGAAGALRDALRIAAETTQVIVTSHSPDLLDDKEVDADWIVGVVSEHGETRIGPIDEADRSVIRDRLFTAGELLKRSQLTPDPEKLKKLTQKQLELFGEGP